MWRRLHTSAGCVKFFFYEDARLRQRRAGGVLVANARVLGEAVGGASEDDGRADEGAWVCEDGKFEAEEVSEKGFTSPPSWRTGRTRHPSCGIQNGGRTGIVHRAPRFQFLATAGSKTGSPCRQARGSEHLAGGCCRAFAGAWLLGKSSARPRRMAGDCQ